MRTMLVVAALIVAAPAVANAQDAADRRREQAYDNLRQLEQTQRIGEVERQLSNMEIRRQSDQAISALKSPTTATYNNPRPQEYETLRELRRTEPVAEIERQLANIELRRQSDEAINALKSPAAAPVATENPYPLAPVAAPVVRAPAPAAQAAPAAPDSNARARDAELAASNARLREIAQAQRAN